MDNFTHSLAGWALGQAGLKTQTRKGLAALILGANAPDIDVFVQSFPWEPLATHRGVTHSLVAGVLVLPVLLWGLLLLLDRWQVSRGTTFKSGLALHKGWLLALCFLGALTHPLLDLQNTYSVQLLSPFSGAWYHADGLFIIDAYLWGTIPLAIAWSRMREKQGRPYTGVVRWALAAAAVYLAFNIGLSTAVREKTRAMDSCGKTQAVYAGPAPVLFWKRDIVFRRDAGPDHPDSAFAYGRGRFDLFNGWSGFDDQMWGQCALQPDRIHDPIVRKAIASDPRLRKFLFWSTMPIADVRQDKCVAHVTIGDARYGERAARARLSRETLVPTC